MFHEQFKRQTTMDEAIVPAGGEKKPVKVKGGDPFQNGFVPNGKAKKKAHNTYLTKRSLLKYMLDVDINIHNLPVKMADELRGMFPGWFDDVEKRFTMAQIMELVQFQLLFSKSDYVKQQAIDAIKDRVYGKPVQKLQVEDPNQEPTELKLPGGRVITL